MAGEAADEEVSCWICIISPTLRMSSSSPGVKTKHLLFAVVQQDNFPPFIGDAVVGAEIVFLHVVHGVLLLSAVSNVGNF